MNMDTPRSSKAKRSRPTFDTVAEESYNNPVLFAVVVERVVGEVRQGDGDLTPREAAFLLIARDDSTGTYRFPNEDGTTAIVDVGMEDNRQQAV